MGHGHNEVSQRSLEEQQEIKALLQFIPKTQAHPGYYKSKLSLKKDYPAHTVDNYDQANDANIRMLHSLEGSPADKQAIQDSFSDLLSRGFIIPLADML